MTATDLTRSLIYLDLPDVDGLIDIVRYGVEPMATKPTTRQLIQRLANSIVPLVLGDEAMAAVVGNGSVNPEDDEERPLFEGRAVLAVLPVAALAMVNPPVD